MASSAEAVLDIRANGASFFTDVDKAEKKSQSLGKEFERVGKQIEGFGKSAAGLSSLLGTFASVLSVGALINFGKSVIADADALMRMHDTTGITVEGLQRLQAAADDSGNTLDELTSAITKMEDKLASGDSSAVSALRQLGLSLEDLKRMSPDQQFMEIGEAISQIEDPAQQVRIAMDLFGKSGAEVLPTLKRGFEDLREASVGMSRETIENMDTLGDAWTALGRKVKAVGADLLASTLPAVMRAAAEVKRFKDQVEGIKPPSRVEGAKAPAISVEEERRAIDDLNDSLREAEKQHRKVEAATKKAAEAAERAAEAAKRFAESAQPLSFKTFKEDAFPLVGLMADLSKQVENFRQSLEPDELLAVQDATEGLGYEIEITSTAIEDDFIPGMAKLGKTTGATAKEMKGFRDSLKDIFSGDFKSGFKGLGEAALNAIDPTIVLSNLVSDGISRLNKLVEKGVSSLFRTIFKSEQKEVNRTRQAFVDAAGGIDELNRRAVRAGVSLDALLNAKKVKDYEQAVRDLNAAFEFQDQAMEDLAQTVAKYKFSIQELGPALERQNLDKMAQEIYHDWRILAAAGIDIAAIAREMGQNINDFVQRAIKSGFEIPEAMRPIIEEMIRLGQLTDEAGNKITDINQSGIRFSMTMTQGFQALIRAVDNLTRAIARALGISIDLGNEWRGMPPPPGFPGDGGPGEPPGPPPAQALGGYYQVMRPQTFLAGEAGREDVVFGGAGRNLARDVATELARVLPTPSAAHMGATTINMVVDGKVVAHAVLDNVAAGGDTQTKFGHQVRRHQRH
jgi:hypothetical protein